MFDDLIRQLQRLEHGIRIPIDVPLDADGYFDRRCPSNACGATFKVLFEDWRDKVEEEVAYCPMCREAAPSSDWSTEEQSDYIEQVGMAHVTRLVGDAMRRGAEAFNRQQPRGGFLTISMEYKPGATPVVIPIDAADEMRQKFTCEACGCRYSSVGAAFFCPACGHNSAATAFQGTVDAVRKTVAALPRIRAAVEDPDLAEDTARRILENDLVRLVGAFQRYAEAAFQSLPAAAATKVRKNAFQNLKESSDLWRAVIGKGYEDMLSGAEMSDLTRLFQQRHKIAHTEGIVDADYIAKSGDSTYSVGQRIIVREEAVLRLADLLSKLSAQLK